MNRRGKNYNSDEVKFYRDFQVFINEAKYHMAQINFTKKKKIA